WHMRTPAPCLLCTDPSLPRPSISLSPTGVTAPGADVTIRCQGQRWDVTFFLHKAGDLNPQRHVDPAGDGAKFRIPTVGRQHGGNYSCSYRLRSEPFVSSEPSDPVQLVVAGEGPEGQHPEGMLRGAGTVSLGSSPARGSSSSWRFRAEGGGILPPGGAAEQGPFPGDDPPAAPALGTHKGVRAWGCRAGTIPSHNSPSRG
uniref:Uncharacterized protein n=1 Tax=Terrapene triunguis TaxID=2587831 RepID=A0A674J6E4_9SAUR